MWKPLLILLSLAVHALGDSSIPLIVYKRRVQNTEVYKYRLGGRYFASPANDGYSLINGDNIEQSEFTYIKVYQHEHYPGGDRNYDSFDKELDVCEVSFRSYEITFKTHYLSGSGCFKENIPTARQRLAQSVSSAGLNFYVSSERPKRVPSVRVFLTQCIENNGRFFFSSLTTGRSSCPQGSREDVSVSFYALPHNGIACPDFDVQRGNIRTSNVVEGVFPTRVTLECNTGYEVEGRKSADCQDGRWSNEIGRCERVTCGRPRNIDNGRVEGDDFTYEGRIRYSCDTGYELSLPYSAVRTCEFTGRWNPAEEPDCLRKSCGSPGDLIYGAVNQPGEQYRDIATYVCDDGYNLVGDEQRLCQDDGTWSGSVPRCERITCEPLIQPRNGQHDGSSSSNFVSGSVVSFKCHEGYELDGANLLRCLLDDSQQSAQWSNEAPLCNAITCRTPEVSSSVEIEGNDFTYGKTIKFRCREGHQLNGTSIAICTATGWDTEPPSCSALSCNKPAIPDNGNRIGDSFTAYHTVTFSCDTGYELTPSDSETIICLPNTRWNKPSPICEPKKCPDLPRLENGLLSTELFQYGTNITFECFPGYQLQGNPEISCQVNGQWNLDMPQCIACPRNHYKSGVNQDACRPCPVRSITLAKATTSINHCMCEEGSSKQDGTCVAIRCVNLAAPENGAVSECQPSSGSQCVFSCEPGYILSGSRERRCLQSGWTGTPPVCTACPANTYKAAEGSQTCIPCPVNSHTDGKIGTSLESCVCKSGYTRASGAVGGCYDINECLENNGGCADRCSNIEGSYYCQCTIPGYTLNQDEKTCNMTSTCATLNQEPSNGETICQYNQENNGWICHFKCAPGYFFVSGINNYVTCGPETNYKWSHQLLNDTARLPACTQEFYVDTQIPLTFDYLTEAPCDEALNQRDQILDKIMEVVKTFDTCTKRVEGGCGLKYLVLNCSDTESGTQRKVDVSFEIFLKNPNEEEVGPTCDNNCIRINMRQMLQDTLNLKNSFQSTVTDDVQNSALERYVGVDLQVVTTSFTFGRPRLLCVDEGEVYTKRRLCVPCGAGTYLAKKDSESCTPCPIGTFQEKLGQTDCNKCLPGSSTASEGSDHAAMCSVRVTQIEGRSRKRRSLHPEATMTAEEVDEVLKFLDM